jgi:hypothetical protein
VSVLAEALSIIVRRTTLQATYPGGVEAYQRACPNATFCADKNLTRIGFMVPADVERWLGHLQNAGLTFMLAGIAADIAVVDQFKGATTPCPWLEGGRSPKGYSAVWLAGTEPGELAHPPGWTPSQSASLKFVGNKEVADRVLHMKSVPGMDILLDFKSGKEVYVGRVRGVPSVARPAPMNVQPSVASRPVDARMRLKTRVFLETGAAVAAVIAGQVLSSEAFWWASILILWVAYVHHARGLWRSDSESYPRFLNIWPWLFRRARGGKQPSTTPFFPDVALETAFAPLFASSVWFVWQWVGWKCGGDTDRYSEIPISEPFYLGILQLFVIGYYWWTVNRRFKSFRQTPP